MKYIDAEQLRAEIERLKEETCIGICEYDKGEENGRLEVLNHLLSTITSLQQEQQEVDLEKEINSYCGTRDIRPVPDFMDAVARHFFELGLSARKE